MQSTAKQLFLLCANEMTRNQKTYIMNESNTTGFIQRNIINLASEVEEVVITFDSYRSSDEIAKQIWPQCFHDVFTPGY